MASIENAVSFAVGVVVGAVAASIVWGYHYQDETEAAAESKAAEPDHPTTNTDETVNSDTLEPCEMQYLDAVVDDEFMPVFRDWLISELVQYIRNTDLSVKSNRKNVPFLRTITDTVLRQYATSTVRDVLAQISTRYNEDAWKSMDESIVDSLL